MSQVTDLPTTSVGTETDGGTRLVVEPRTRLTQRQLHISIPTECK